MKYNEFRKEVIDWAKNEAPKQWRLGQSVFNYIDDTYGVARTVQTVDNIDCFYDDSDIEPFIIRAYVHISNE